jgi:chromosome transmission fidelity protein 18
MDRVTRAMESSTLSGFTAGGNGKAKPNCLILDEIDGADSSAAIQALVDLIKAEPAPGGNKGGSSKNAKARTTPYLRRPIIFVCNNKYAPALRPLLPYALHFQIEPPTPAKLVTRLRAVLQAEGLSINGGSSLLHQLVAVSGGDIRYCLMALQFAATKAVTPSSSGGAPDISAPLLLSLRGGSSGKDTRSDVLSVLTAVFQKKRQSSGGGRKKKTQKSASEPQEMLSHLVASYGDNSKLLDLLFLNAMNISFIDPTMDRCATLYEWLSHADTFRCTTSSVALANSSLHHTLQNLYIPSTANALHCLCRVEQRQELTFSDRELYDIRFRQEANQELAFRIAEGIVPACKTARTTSLMGIETASYVLWVLSAGYGKCALDRAVTSVKLLKDNEQQAFTHHADVLRSMGLSYKMDPADYTDPSKPPSEFRLKLEPPLQYFARYTNGHRSRRRPVPDMVCPST